MLAGLVLVGSTAAVVGGVFGEGLASLMPRLWATVDAGLATTGSLIGMFFAFLLLYWVLPNTQVSLRQALPGALLGAGLFVAVLRIFPFYVALFGAGFSVYAAFGTVLVFMLWLYIVGVVVVGGAELNAFLHERSGRSHWRQSPRAP